MNVQFNHKRNLIITRYYIVEDIVEVNPRGGETIAVQTLEPWFVESLKPEDFFTKLVGKARCSDEENYNKKTGRELAKSRMKATVLTVLSNQDFGGVRVLVLKDDKGNIYTFQKRLENRGVHFVGYNE